MAIFKKKRNSGMQKRRAGTFFLIYFIAIAMMLVWSLMHCTTVSWQSRDAYIGGGTDQVRRLSHVAEEWGRDGSGTDASAEWDREGAVEIRDGAPLAIRVAAGEETAAEAGEGGSGSLSHAVSSRARLRGVALLGYSNDNALRFSDETLTAEVYAVGDRGDAAAEGAGGTDSAADGQADETGDAASGAGSGLLASGAFALRGQTDYPKDETLVYIPLDRPVADAADRELEVHILSAGLARNGIFFAGSDAPDNTDTSTASGNPRAVALSEADAAAGTAGGDGQEARAIPFLRLYYEKKSWNPLMPLLYFVLELAVGLMALLLYGDRTLPLFRKAGPGPAPAVGEKGRLGGLRPLAGQRAGGGKGRLGKDGLEDVLDEDSLVGLLDREEGRQKGGLPPRHGRERGGAGLGRWTRRLAPLAAVFLVLFYWIQYTDAYHMREVAQSLDGEILVHPYGNGTTDGEAIHLHAGETLRQQFETGQAPLAGVGVRFVREEGKKIDSLAESSYADALVEWRLYDEEEALLGSGSARLGDLEMARPFLGKDIEDADLVRMADAYALLPFGEELYTGLYRRQGLLGTGEEAGTDLADSLRVEGISDAAARGHRFFLEISVREGDVYLLATENTNGQMARASIGTNWEPVQAQLCLLGAYQNYGFLQGMFGRICLACVLFLAGLYGLALWAAGPAGGQALAPEGRRASGGGQAFPAGGRLATGGGQAFSAGGRLATGGGQALSAAGLPRAFADSPQAARNRIALFYLVCALAAGMVFSFLTPAFTVPDERTHIDAVYVLSNRLMGLEIEPGPKREWKRAADIDASIANTMPITAARYRAVEEGLFGPAPDLSASAWQKAGQGAGSPAGDGDEGGAPEEAGAGTAAAAASGREGVSGKTLVQAYTRNMAVNVPVLCYLPAAMGFTAARLLGRNMVTMVMAGRWANLLACIAILYAAIRRMPYGGACMAIVALFPKSLQQIASCSYDGMIIAAAFLFMAYCLALAFDEEVCIVDLMVFVLSGFFVASCKAGAYLPVLGLAFLIPALRARMGGPDKLLVFGGAGRRARWAGPAPARGQSPAFGNAGERGGGAYAAGSGPASRRAAGTGRGKRGTAASGISLWTAATMVAIGGSALLFVGKFAVRVLAMVSRGAGVAALETGDKVLYTMSDLLQDPARFILLCRNTIFVRGDGLLGEMVGKNLSQQWYIVYGFLLLAFLAILRGRDVPGGPKSDGGSGGGWDRPRIQNHLGLGSRLWILFLLACSVAIIFLCLILDFTANDMDYIDGLQGRYFLPLAPLYFLLLENGAIRREGIEDAWLLYGAAVLLGLTFFQILLCYTC